MEHGPLGSTRLADPRQKRKLLRKTPVVYVGKNLTKAVKWNPGRESSTELRRHSLECAEWERAGRCAQRNSGVFRDHPPPHKSLAKGTWPVRPMEALLSNDYGPGNRTEIIELEQRSHLSQESHVNTSFSIWMANWDARSLHVRNKDHTLGETYFKSAPTKAKSKVLTREAEELESEIESW